MGLEIFRLKTGTPPRIKKSSIDFSKATPQYGMEGNYAFSYLTKEFKPLKDQVLCWLIYTNENTHKLITDNLDKTATYNGLQTGVGPRYCPSIESKVMTFRDKKRHQLFLEPEFADGESIYLQGFSTAMDEEMQEKIRLEENLKNVNFEVSKIYQHKIKILNKQYKEQGLLTKSLNQSLSKSIKKASGDLSRDLFLYVFCLSLISFIV